MAVLGGAGVHVGRRPGLHLGVVPGGATEPEPAGPYAFAFLGDPDLVALYDPSVLEGVEAGATVGSLTPRAGAQLAPLAQTDAGRHPTYLPAATPSGRPALSFTSDRLLVTWPSVVTQPLTTLGIVRSLKPNGADTTFYSGVSGQYAYVGSTTGGSMSMGAGGTNQIVAGPIGETWHAFVAVFNDGGSPEGRLYVDDRDPATGSVGTHGLPGVAIGSNSSGSSYFNSENALLGIVDRVVDDATARAWCADLMAYAGIPATA